MATSRQNQQFIDTVIPDGLLEEAIAWIKSNMTPEDVFEPSELSDWALGNEFIRDED